MSPSTVKKVSVAAIETVGAISFVAAWILGVYWSMTRTVPAPALGRVIQESSHGSKYYLTLAESRIVSEPVFMGSVSLVFLAAFLRQRWNISK